MIPEKAEDLGRVIGQSHDYKAVKVAREAVDASPELRGKLDRLEQIAREVEERTPDGRDPTDAERSEYEQLLSEIQADSRYQRLVAAQANFDKLMLRVNEHIMEGIKKGATSPIITPG